MTKEKYRQERLDPRWQKKRLEIMQRDDFKCRSCECAKETLNVHHAYYVKGRKCWNYPSFALETLCWECHEQRHALIEDDDRDHHSDLERTIDFLTGGYPEDGFLWNLGVEFTQTAERIGRGNLMNKLETITRWLREQSK